MYPALTIRSLSNQSHTMRSRLVTTLMLLFLLPAAAFAQFDDVESRPQVTVTDASINAGDRVEWTSDNVYILDGAVFVEPGAILRIEAGTVIKAEDGNGLDASALIITRGAQIFAEGTATDPIIFTSVNDNISGPDALTYQSRGQWGGIVLLGAATTNSVVTSGGTTVFPEIEGVNELVGDGDDRAEFGGTNDDDNSGVMRYVSIRHTGQNIGSSDGNEIQGLTVGGVGRGTTLEYVESYASGDDGFEFFGGTVNTKYLVSAFNADDSFDFDHGWRSQNQFWFAIQGTDVAGALAEQDGGESGFNGEDAPPFADVQVYNATLVGAGVGNQPETDRAEALIFRDYFAGSYRNSIITDFETADGGFGIRIENLDGATGDSQARFEAGDIVLANNIWSGFGAGEGPANFVEDDDGNAGAIIDFLNANSNYYVDPQLGGVSRALTGDGGLDPRPQAGSPALTNALASYPDDPFYTPVNYIGAFGGNLWLRGWTALDQLGYLGDLSDPNVAIEPVGGDIPSQIALGQNYPNPFNPSTMIEFKLNAAQDIRLAVFDLLGREVAVLVDGVQPAGTFRTAFDASNLSSGTYLYRLETANGTATKLMTLVK